MDSLQASGGPLRLVTIPPNQEPRSEQPLPPYGLQSAGRESLFALQAPGTAPMVSHGPHAPRSGPFMQLGVVRPSGSLPSPLEAPADSTARHADQLSIETVASRATTPAPAAVADIGTASDSSAAADKLQTALSAIFEAARAVESLDASDPSVSPAQRQEALRLLVASFSVLHSADHIAAPGPAAAVDAGAPPLHPSGGLNGGLGGGRGAPAQQRSGELSVAPLLAAALPPAQPIPTDSSAEMSRSQPETSGSAFYAAPPLAASTVRTVPAAKRPRLEGSADPPSQLLPTVPAEPVAAGLHPGLAAGVFPGQLATATQAPWPTGPAELPPTAVGMPGAAPFPGPLPGAPAAYAASKVEVPGWVQSQAVPPAWPPQPAMPPAVQQLGSMIDDARSILGGGASGGASATGSVPRPHPPPLHSQALPGSGNLLPLPHMPSLHGRVCEHDTPFPSGPGAWQQPTLNRLSSWHSGELGTAGGGGEPSSRRAGEGTFDMLALQQFVALLQVRLSLLFTAGCSLLYN